MAPEGIACMWYTDIHVGKTPTYKKNKYKENFKKLSFRQGFGGAHF